jgi:hypothetical protein
MEYGEAQKGRKKQKYQIEKISPECGQSNVAGRKAKQHKNKRYCDQDACGNETKGRLRLQQSLRENKWQKRKKHQQNKMPDYVE